MEKWSGIYTALLTPFDSQNKISDVQLAKLIEINLNMGVTGFYVGGSTAEAFMLSMDERKYILDVAVSAAKGKGTIISHIGCISTEQAIELGEYSKKLGVDAISAVPPFYYKFTFDEIKGYYFDIVNAVDLPMLIYNMPAFSGVTIDKNNVGDFLDDDRFMGVKHTSNDFYSLERYKKLYPHKKVYNGYDEMFLAGLAMGADGGIGSTYNCMADRFVRIFDLFNKGELEAAQYEQSEINDIIDAIVKAGVFQGEKEILRLMGLDFGVCRPPFKPITEEGKTIIAEIVEKYNMAG